MKYVQKAGSKQRGRPHILKDPIAKSVVFERETIKAIKLIGLPVSEFIREAVAGKLSREKSVEIRKVDDESFGQVNSYNIEILKEVFQI